MFSVATSSAEASVVREFVGFADTILRIAVSDRLCSKLRQLKIVIIVHNLFQNKQKILKIDEMAFAQMGVSAPASYFFVERLLLIVQMRNYAVKSRILPSLNGWL